MAKRNSVLVQMDCRKRLRLWAKGYLPKHITLRMLKTGGKSPILCHHRRRAWLYLRSQGYSYPTIGEVMGFHHTTVMYGVARVLAERADASNSNREAPGNEGTEVGGLAQ